MPPKLKVNRSHKMTEKETTTSPEELGEQPDTGKTEILPREEAGKAMAEYLEDHPNAVQDVGKAQAMAEAEDPHREALSQINKEITTLNNEFEELNKQGQELPRLFGRLEAKRDLYEASLNHSVRSSVTSARALERVKAADESATAAGEAYDKSH
jgi:uncharacterized coiled-coil DUF342 family protein